MRLRAFISVAAILAILASCGRKGAVPSAGHDALAKEHASAPAKGSLQATQAPSSTPAPAHNPDGTPVWDERFDCFNGLFMVRSDGLYGITDEAGTILVPPECDSLEFLSDEVLLLFKGGTASLADRRGRVFAESGDIRSLRDNFQSLRDKAADESIRRWNAFLDDFESFGRECEKGRSGRVSRREWKALKAHAASLLESLPSMPSDIAENQKDRLSSIIANYSLFAR